MNPVIKALIITGCALFEVSAYSQQLTIAQLQAALKNQYTPEAVHATGYVQGAYDAMAGIVHCPTGMTPTRDTLIKWTREGLDKFNSVPRGFVDRTKGADYLLAAVFAERAPCAKRGTT
jgi:hypothetical protein